MLSLPFVLEPRHGNVTEALLSNFVFFWRELLNESDLNSEIFTGI